MTKSLSAAVIIFSFLFVMPFTSYASQLDEGVTAYERQDYSLAYQKLLPLAKQGGGQAQYYVGDMLVGGMGVPADMDKGVYWLEQSVENKYYMAAKTLGKMYMSGFGVPMDPERGAKYLLLYQSLIPEGDDEPECD